MRAPAFAGSYARARVRFFVRTCARVRFFVRWFGASSGPISLCFHVQGKFKQFPNISLSNREHLDTPQPFAGYDTATSETLFEIIETYLGYQNLFGILKTYINLFGIRKTYLGLPKPIWDCQNLR